MKIKPKQYLIKLYFRNLDPALGTQYQAHMAFSDTYAISEEHAQMLAKHLQKVFAADDYEVLK